MCDKLDLVLKDVQMVMNFVCSVNWIVSNSYSRDTKGTCEGCFFFKATDHLFIDTLLINNEALFYHDYLIR